MKRYYIRALMILILLAGSEWAMHRHAYNPIEAIPYFYVLFGFIASMVFFITARRCITWLQRDKSSVYPKKRKSRL